MAISTDVAKDPAKIKSKFIGNFTKRQIVCFGTAALVGVPIYFALKGVLGTDMAAIVMVAAMLPFFVFAMYEKNGLPAEKYFMQVVRMKFRPGIRKYRSENRFLLEDERKQMEMEVRALEEKRRKRDKSKGVGK